MDCSDPCTVSAGDSIPIQWVDAPANDRISAWLVWRQSVSHHTGSEIDIAMEYIETSGAGRGNAIIGSNVVTGDHYYLKVELSNNRDQDRVLGPIRVTSSNNTRPLYTNTPETWQVRNFCYEPCSGGSDNVHLGDWLRLEFTGIPEETRRISVSLTYYGSGVDSLLDREPIKDEMFVMIPWEDYVPPGDYYYILVTDDDNYNYRTTSPPFSITNEIATSNPGYTPDREQQFTITPVTQIPPHLQNDGSNPQGNAIIARNPHVVFSTMVAAFVVGFFSLLY
ncbi:hypothetical protein K492DRAFT_191593 [Lichtheimia hyalospora FSU 10163]|nr:hypothetical protein K492DRAFT_191593 [Lichtheimia hyalospora FSU 10163]